MWKTTIDLPSVQNPIREVSSNPTAAKLALSGSGFQKCLFDAQVNPGMKNK